MVSRVGVDGGDGATDVDSEKRDVGGGRGEELLEGMGNDRGIEPEGGREGGLDDPEGAGNESG